MKTIVETLSQFKDREYLTLPGPMWQGREELSTGVFLRALYRGPRSGRFFRLIDSIWQKQNGRGNEGEKYQEIDEQTFLHHCAAVGCEPKIQATQS